MDGRVELLDRPQSLRREETAPVAEALEIAEDIARRTIGQVPRLALEEQDRPELLESPCGSPEDGELVAFDVDLHERDRSRALELVVQGVGCDLARPAPGEAAAASSSDAPGEFSHPGT